MTMEPLISIIVPVYNCETFLSQCVNSLLEQTYPHIEIILVNDGSKDNSGNICEALAFNNSKVNVIHQVNNGAAKARQTGVLHARGEYVVFIDADDWVETDYIESLVSIALKHKCDIVISTYKSYTEDKYITNPQYFNLGFYDEEMLKKYIYPSMLSAKPFFKFGIMPSMCGKLFRIDVAKDNLKTLENEIFFGEDGCFVYSVLLDCKSIYITEYSGYIYRNNPNSVTHTFNSKIMEDNLKLKNFYLELICKKKWNIDNQLDEYLTYLCDFTITSALLSSNPPKVKELKEYINYLYPKNISKNKKFNQMTFKRRFKFFLIRTKMLNLLKVYLKFRRS